MSEHRSMGFPPRPASPVSFRGEVVEIFEEQGQRLAKVVLEPRTVLDVAVQGGQDVHLGDRVVIHGAITVDRLMPEVNSGSRRGGVESR